MRITIFPSLTTTRGLSRDVDLAALLAAPPLPPAKKEDQPLWSSATFTGTRALANVASVSALGLDFDDGHADVLEHLACWSGVHVLWHTSWSHNPEAPHYRLILPLSRPVTPAEYARLWLYAQEVHANAHVNVDKSCKDPSRAWFWPAALPNYECGDQPGALLDVDALLANVPEIIDPPAPALAPTKDAPWPIVQRAEKYLAKMPASISGQHGHDRLFSAAIAMVRGFDLPQATALPLLQQFNLRCDPPWKLKDLQHKVADAAKSTAAPGYLLRPRQR